MAFDDKLLNIIFGGALYGIMTTIALKANASTGGTDFIALYVSNKKNKSIFNYVFVFNATMLVIFGAMFGWENAGYSIPIHFNKDYRDFLSSLCTCHFTNYYILS